MADREGHRTLDPMSYIRSLDIPFPARLPIRPFHDATDEEEPILVFADDEAEFSTVTDLVPLSSLPVWDVNGYYRELGLRWPFRPTKRELLRAYIATTELQTGENRQRSTYIFKRLVNTTIRRKYDLRALGNPIDDYYGWKRVEKLASDWIRDQNQLHADSAGEGEGGLTMDDYLASLGMPTLEEMEAQVAASALPLDPEVCDEYGRAVGDWRWNFYLLGSARADTDTLSQWQAMIVAACAEQGLRVCLTLGYVGSTSSDPWSIREHSNHVIVFINDSIDITPSMTHAEAIASSLVKTHPPQEQP